MPDFYATESKITCADKFAIAATTYTPKKALKGAILIGPATGIKRQFYASFSSFLAEKGYGVVTFDNRGIGGSLLGSVKESDASLQCWGEKDMPAVFEQLKASFPNTKYHLIGHSAGGQLVGLMHNAMELTSIFNFASSSGQLKNMRASHAVKAHFFMNFFIPFSNTFFGHTKSQWLGMGEPLPKAVAQQWREWCNSEGYVKASFGKTVHTHLYDDLSIPTMWVNAVDDEIAIDANVEDMLKVFTKVNAETLTLSPDDYALDEIGHMKFFSRKSQVLWIHVLNWLEKQ
ncbi:alpha/beta hydrolase [Colwellia demingiae]|uniref:Alpha/beta hydrolase n=1 Tax=Colwellia demingiae TaxID=89401 RepID=A0A5C6Q7R9_9GAMM|nr:alpha/beta fold hydrolase [Colwellia demingiae]TWX64772.1 alpha/beta hydrolase [Colwellia demingiae]